MFMLSLPSAGCFRVADHPTRTTKGGVGQVEEEGRCLTVVNSQRLELAYGNIRGHRPQKDKDRSD
jgi:hypothetical protein